MIALPDEYSEQISDWLHKRGIIRLASKTSKGGGQVVELRITARRWIPEKTIRAFATDLIQRKDPGLAQTHRLSEVGQGDATLAGTREWRLRYRHAGPEGNTGV